MKVEDMTDDVCVKIIDAFAEIEKHDIRVGRVNMPEKAYSQLVNSSDFGGFDNFSLATHRRDMLRPNNEFRIGNLWGAEVFFSDTFEVHGEKNFVPANPQGVVVDGNCIKCPIPFKVFIGNLTIFVKSRARPIRGANYAELTAIETLREMISEAEYRKYIKDGFICVRGASGKVYQIFRGRNHTRIWENGVVIEEVCVYISDRNIPPTDAVIAFKTIIETSEEEFKSLGNVYNLRRQAA